MASFYEELNQSRLIVDDKENEQSRLSIDKWIFRLLLFLLGFMPIIMLANVEQVISPLVSNVDLLSSGMKGDIFTHYKALLLVVVTFIVATMLLAKIFFMGGSILKSKINYVLVAFVGAIIISTIASPNVTIALNGQYNRSDGAISWLCYVVLMFVAMNIKYPKKTINYIMYTLLPFVYINLYIVTMNFYGKDLMQQSWVQKVISMALPSGATISNDSQLVGTLNQWNYMSGMFAVMTVMYLIWSITSEKWIDAIIGSIASSISILIMFMSVSTSGFVVTVLFIPIFILICILIKNKKQGIVSILLFLCLTSIFFVVLYDENKQIWNESFGVIFGKHESIEDMAILFDTKNVVSANTEVLELPVVGGMNWSLGTGRVYIWDKTLDLISERAILGYGVDTLMYNFPHFNKDARSGLMDQNTITDKAHNLYLGTFYGLGILGIMSLLVLVLGSAKYFIQSIRLKSWPILILTSASIAYFIQALFNDSLPSSTATIFVVMGIAISLFNDKLALKSKI